MSVETSPPARRMPLPSWLFVVAWTATHLVPTVLLLIWRLIDAKLGLTGASADDPQSSGGLLEMPVFAVGMVSSLLLQASLLHQFRDRTRGWVFANLGALALYLVVVGVVGAVAAILRGELPELDQWRAWTALCLSLIVVAVTCALFRTWGWRHVAWLTYGIIMSLTTPLFEFLRQVTEKQAGRAVTNLAPGDTALVATLSEAAGDLVAYLPLSAVTAWVLWRYVAVHRRVPPVDASAPGA
jgi:hypothetical protein